MVGPSGTRLLMWAASSNHGDRCSYASMILSNTAPFRVTFQAEVAEVGGDVWTDIALDDISFTTECVVGGQPLSQVLSLALFPNLSQIDSSIFIELPFRSLLLLPLLLSSSLPNSKLNIPAISLNDHVSLSRLFPPSHPPSILLCSSLLTINWFHCASGRVEWCSELMQPVGLQGLYKFTVESGFVAGREERAMGEKSNYICIVLFSHTPSLPFPPLATVASSASSPQLYTVTSHMGCG